MSAVPNFTLERDGGGWKVCCDGKKVWGVMNCYWKAEEALERLKRKAARKERNCITCGSYFMSDGPGHRMCKNCRASSSAIFDGAV